MTESLPVVFIRQKFQHMGSHSGYDLLASALHELLEQKHDVFLNNPQLSRLGQKCLNLGLKGVYGTPFYGGGNLLAEVRAVRVRYLQRKIIHVLFGEDNLGLLARFNGNFRNRIVCTVHQPLAWWRQKGIDAGRLLNKLDVLVVLSSRERDAFAEFTNGQVEFVPHGVDTGFFRPAENTTAPPPQGDAPLRRCVFVGNWLRDYKSLSQILALLHRRQESVALDLVTPERADRSAEDQAHLAEIVGRPNVTWHKSVDDERLRQIYQNGDMLLLPLLESTANNAILEAMACGLPIVTNETRGIDDYTEPSYAFVSPRGDVEGMFSSVMRIIHDPSLRHSMGTASRATAVNSFDWRHVAHQMKRVYDSLN